jgi:hypothetical protein
VAYGQSQKDDRAENGTPFHGWSPFSLKNPVPPPVRKAPHPGKPRAFFLIFGPVKNRQVDHLAVQGQGKAGDLPGVQAQVGAQADRGPGFETGGPGRLDQVGNAGSGDLDLLFRFQEVDGVIKFFREEKILFVDLLPADFDLIQVLVEYSFHKPLL